MLPPLSPVTQRFPLVARPRPPCPPLDLRIRELTDLARTAADPTEGDPIAVAATVHNKAALIASDCGLPELARSLCWNHFNLYTPAYPLDAKTAQHALEPLVNLARLRIRDGDGDGAYQLLANLHQAVKTRTDTIIAGTPISLRNLVNSDDHRTLCQWLWIVLLADGARALVAANRWDQALAHAQQHRGIGQRLLDGRQVAIINRCLTNDPDGALKLLAETATAEPWEQPVATCLTTLILTIATRPTNAAITTMVNSYLTFQPTLETVVFHVRLGLTVIDLAATTNQPATTQTREHLTKTAISANDGYAARDLLAHHAYRTRLPQADTHALKTTLHTSGLGRAAIPAHTMTRLLAAVTTSREITANALGLPS